MKQTELLTRVFQGLMKEVGTSMPGHIVAFDPITQLAQVQPGIVTTKNDGSTINPDPIFEVHVKFSGGDFLVEHEINPNDEGILIFSQRCIDGWSQTGGIAQNPLLRFHDMNDAYFIPGLRSQPNAIKEFKNDGIRLRNKDGTNYIWLKKDGTLSIKVTTVNIVGDVNATGDITSDKTITGATDVIGGGVSTKDHTHGYIDSKGAAATSTPSTTTKPDEVATP